MRRVSLHATEGVVGVQTLNLDGSTVTSKASKCFSGVYHWSLWQQASHAVVTANLVNYIDPDVTWTINGQQVIGSTWATSIICPTDYALEPLALISDLPARTTTVSAILLDLTTLAIDLPAGQLAVDLDVACNVRELRIPDGYPTKAGASTLVGMNGFVRVMDKRFYKEMNVCITEVIQKATVLLVEGNIPRRDKGDPIPPWIDQQLTGISEQILGETRGALFLAADVHPVNRELGTILRALALGRLAVERGELQGTAVRRRKADVHLPIQTLSVDNQDQVFTPQSLDIPVGAADGPTRHLLIFTGIAVPRWDSNGNFDEETVVVNLRQVVTHQPQSGEWTATVGLASLNNTDSDFTFAANNVSLDMNPDTHELELRVDIGVQGSTSVLNSFSYQVTVFQEAPKVGLQAILVESNTESIGFTGQAQVQMGDQWFAQVLLTGPASHPMDVFLFSNDAEAAPLSAVSGLGPGVASVTINAGQSLSGVFTAPRTGRVTNLTTVTIQATIPGTTQSAVVQVVPPKPLK